MDRLVVLQLDRIGDFSTYTLTVSGPDIDPFFASHKLRFRVGSDEPFDCRPPKPEPLVQKDLAVVIDYLAKDYSSFRQALLEFIPTRLPAWTERSEADIGMMLLELFAATADTLSYLQDRIANEAFLDSATQRRSVARHLALIDYEMDQGVSAYTWLQFQVNAVQLLPSNPGLRVTNKPVSENEPIIVFETHGEVTVRKEHNEMPVYAWGNADCCLPSDALSLALAGRYKDLQPGDYLLLDDGQGQRDVVQLTKGPEIIPATLPCSSPDGWITFVYWSKATPLKHTYCMRARRDPTLPRLVVRGNLAPATHGETRMEESLRKQGLRLQHAPLAYLRTDTPGLLQPINPAEPFLLRQPRYQHADIDGWRRAVARKTNTPRQRAGRQAFPRGDRRHRRCHHRVRQRKTWFRLAAEG